jgi:hypothetical protein
MDHTPNPGAKMSAVHRADLEQGEEDDFGPSPELTPEEQALHQENMARLGRIMRAYGILKIGVTALLIVVIIKFFGR